MANKNKGNNNSEAAKQAKHNKQQFDVSIFGIKQNEKIGQIVCVFLFRMSKILVLSKQYCFTVLLLYFCRWLPSFV